MPDLTVGVDGRRARTGANVVVRSLADIRNAAARTGRSVGNLDRRMKAASTTAAVFRRALGGLGAGLALREFVRLGDSFVNVSNRLKIATDTTEELVAVQERLFQVSQSTRSNYEANATLFNRLALSSRELGISLDEVLNVTESLNQAVILSGAATTEASAGLIQLSQGLASNRLSGDELRSILEQLPVVAETIADSLGITRGELKFFGEQGKLSADVVFKAFREAREELAARFGKTVPTVAQSFVILRNAAIRFVGQLNESTGVITNLSRAVIFLANNFDTLVKGITVAAAALGPLVFGRSIAFASRALLGLSALILSNPIGLLVSGLAAATAAAIAFGDEPLGAILEESEDSFSRAALEALGLADAIREGVIPAQTTLGDIARGVLQSIIQWVTDAANFLRNSFLSAINKVTEFLGIGSTSWADFFNFIRTGINNTIGFFVGLGRGVFTFYREINTLILRGFTEIFDFVKEPIGAVVDLAVRALNFVKGIVGKLFGEVRSAASSLVEDLGVDASFGDLPIINEAVDIGGKVKDAFLSGFETDYVGAMTNILAPAIGTVIENAGQITAQRLADQEAKLNAQGADLTKPRGEGKLLVPIDVQKALKKLIEETATPLEKQVATLKELARIRGFAQTAEEITAVNRAIAETFETRLDEEFDLLGLDSLSDIMTEARGPLENYNIALEKLNQLLAEGALSQEQFDAAVANAKENILGLKNVTEEFARAAAENIQRAFADFLFDPFSEGLDGMARGLGETLRKITSEILSAIILRKLLEGLGSLGGGFGTFANAAIAGLRADGGPVAGGKSYIVGESGPELFTPRQSGMVIPNEMMASSASPTVNVAPAPVVVLDDPAKIGRALQNDPNTQRALVDAVATKKSSINQALR